MKGTTNPEPEPHLDATEAAAQDGNVGRLAQGVAGGLVGAVLAISGVILSVTTQQPGKIVPGLLVVFGMLALLAAILTPPWRLRVGGAVAAALAFAGVIAWIQPEAFAGKTQIVMSSSPSASPVTVLSPSPQPSPPVVTVISPAPGDSRPVSGCLLLKFKAEPPANFTFVVANSTDDDARLYFESQVKHDSAGGEWTTTLKLGDDDDGMGKQYHIQIVLIEVQWATYLGHSRPEDDQTWWSQESLPPTAVPAGKLDVQRNQDPDLDC